MRTYSLIDSVQKTLRDSFHLTEFRIGQREIIDSLLGGRDVMAIMPTGGGKSLCYQLPSQIKKGITLVVSPLIALMNDQVQALRALGIPAGCIHSGLSLAERKQIFNEMGPAEHYLLYLSPERVQKPGFAEWVKKQNLAFIAVDEAHCVSQWGHDFRPEYAQISVLRELRPDVPMIALTATATPIVKRDIADHLSLKKPDEHVFGFYRPNLYYQVEFCQDEEDKEALVLQALEQNPKGRILIYCGTRKKTEEWAAFLNATNEDVAFYHAGLSNKERTQIEEDYKKGRTRILTATNAFGMGVDHPDVRLVLHTQMPGNVESYYQEIGRAGRDGKESTCLLLFSKKDKGLHSFFIRQSDAPARVISNRWQALDAILNYAEGAECRHSEILTYFKDSQRIQNCGHCDSCAPSSSHKIQRPRFLSLKKPKKIKKKAPLVSAELDDSAKWRIEVLRDWRKSYAKENDIPAFMVFSDKTLRDLAQRAPQDLEGLSRVYGLGDKKIETFGTQILEQIREN